MTKLNRWLSKILSDPERRSLYDEYGTTQEPRHGGGGGGGGYHRENYDQFFREFHFGGFGENFFGRGFGNRNNGNQHRKSTEDEINKK